MQDLGENASGDIADLLGDAKRLLILDGDSSHSSRGGFDLRKAPALFKSQPLISSLSLIGRSITSRLSKIDKYHSTGLI